MKREFVINITFLILANLLIKPVYLLWIDIKVQNVVGPDQYGLYLSIISLCYIMQIVLDPGLLNYNTTFIASQRSRIKERLGVMLGLKITLAVLFLLALAIIGRLLEYNEQMMQILKWAGINIALLSLLLYLRSNIAALGNYRWDSLFSILDKSLTIVICIWLLYFKFVDDFQIIYFVWAQTAALGISALTLLVFTHFRAVNLTVRFDFNYFRKIIKSSLPFAWLLFLMTIYTRVDAFMLERLMNDGGYEAGVYASAFRLYDAGNAFAYLFSVLLLPMFSYMISEKQDSKELLFKSSQLMWVLVVSGVICCLFWAEDIMYFFYKKHYTDRYATIFRFMMLAFIPLAFGYIYGTLLTAKKELRKLNAMAVVGVALNVILNYFLIQRIQATGAAIATLTTQLCMLIVQVYFVIKIFKIPLTIKPIAKLLFLSVISICLCFFIKEYIPLHFWINFALSIMLSLLASLLLGILPIHSFLNMIKQKSNKLT